MTPEELTSCREAFDNWADSHDVLYPEVEDTWTAAYAAGLKARDERVRGLVEVFNSLDCRDNSCLFATKKDGMRTNGGCRCFRSSANVNKIKEALAKFNDPKEKEKV